jgi:nitroreductase
VAEGETLKRIKAGYATCYAYAVKADPDLPLPVEWTEATKRRKQGLFPEMVRDSGEAVHQFGTLNQSMFNAAAVVYICMDKILSPWSVYDIGAYSQSFMLSALEHGLGTVPAVTLVIYPEVIRKELNLPVNLQIIAGIAVGYADETNSINNITSSRSPTEENVRFCD